PEDLGREAAHVLAAASSRLVESRGRRLPLSRPRAARAARPGCAAAAGGVRLPRTVLNEAANALYPYLMSMLFKSPKVRVPKPEPPIPVPTIDDAARQRTEG